MADARERGAPADAAADAEVPMEEDQPVTGRDIPKAAFRAMLDAGYEMAVEEAARTAGPPTPDVFCRPPRRAPAGAGAAAEVFDRHRTARRRIERAAWDDLLGLRTADWVAMWDACPNREAVACAIGEWQRERD